MVDKPFTPREIIAAMLLEHDAGGITMATLRDARTFIATPANGEQVERVKVLEEALGEAHDTLHECTAVLTADDCAKVAAVMSRARTALGNKETDRHG